MLDVLGVATTSDNHNIVTASLEAMQQFVKSLKGDLIPWFQDERWSR